MAIRYAGAREGGDSKKRRAVRARPYPRFRRCVRCRKKARAEINKIPFCSLHFQEAIEAIISRRSFAA